VQDAAATVRRLAAQCETSVGFAVKAGAQRRESLDVTYREYAERACRRARGLLRFRLARADWIRCSLVVLSSRASPGEVPNRERR
jgi:hypothetical protein